MGNRVEVSITKMKYGWSKYGGGRYGLVKEERFGEWFCQSCSKRQPNELGQYMMDIGGMREFVRVCGNCKNQALTNKIKSFMTLSALIRSSEVWS